MSGIEGLVTVKEAAEELGVSPVSLYEAIHMGRLPAVRVLGRYAVARADLETYRARTRPTGEKPKGRPRKIGAIQEGSTK